MKSRGLWRVMGARTKRSLALSWSALFVLSLLLQYFTFALAPAALAVHEEGLFELDGNATDSAAIEPDDDWDSLNHALATVHIGASSEAAANDVTYFTGGGSKDVNDVSQWNYTSTDVTPDKDDILDAFAAAYEKNGDTFVYFGADRFDGSGDSFVGFWFFQNNIGLAANGNFSGVHKNGDILVLSDFTNGGSVAEIKIYEWLNGNISLKESGAACDLPGQEQACAVVNGGVVSAPWTFTDKDGNHSFQAGEFYEGGINLDTVFGGDAPCFSGFLAETRSSQSTSAQLKDFALGNFNTCVPPTITTDASVSTFHFGDAAVTDTATLAGTDGPASGKVKFFVCDPTEITAAGCPSGGTQVGAAAGVTVATSANGGTATSAGFTPTAAGKYCFRAEYVPDAASQYLAGSHTNATTECFTAVKNPTSITTAANQTVDVGTAIADSATLSGATADAGGSIVFKAYGPNDGTCSNAAAFTSAPVAVSGNGTYGPVSFTPDIAGTYHWIATYSGDAKNIGSAGDCGDTGENDTVTKVDPTIATQASAAVTVGGDISDTATVSGGHSPTGTVSFALYGPNDATCAGGAIFTSANRPLNGSTATSAAFTTTQAGTYRWIATYNGDANNNAVSGSCNDANESVVVNPAQPTIATSLVGDGQNGASISVVLGTTVHDTSTLSGATATAGGTVHYQVFTNVGCTTLFSDAGTVPVVNGVPGNSTDVQFNQAGIYYWQADYSGDPNNVAASSNCSLETVSVGLNTPTISTNASDSVVVGGQIHDTATLAGGFNPTGTITFRLFGPNDATCATTPVFTSTVNVNGNGDYISSAFTTISAGVYRWIATYNGDANNAVVAGSCNDANENVVVTTPNLHAVKLVSTNDEAFAGSNTALPGDIVNYQITVSNSGDADATNVPVSDDISAILAHATYNDDCNLGCSLVGSTLNWTIPTIAKSGGSVELTFSVTLDDTFPLGTTILPNVVVVTGPGSNCAAGSDDADCDTTTDVATSRLVIEKSFTGNSNGTDPDLGVPSAKVGDTLHYTLAYEGGGVLTHAKITDVLPKGLDFVAAQGNADFAAGVYDSGTRTITWNALHVLPQDADNNVSGSVTYDVKVSAAAPEFAQPLVNLATIDSDETAPVSDTASVAVLAPPLDLTPPPTDTFTPQTGTSNPGFALMLILLGVAGLTLGIGFITPAPARVRRRDRLG